MCLAQSVGAANLAAGLQDAYLGRCAGDRASAAARRPRLPAPQRVPGDRARAAVRRGDKILVAGRGRGGESCRGCCGRRGGRRSAGYGAGRRISTLAGHAGRRDRDADKRSEPSRSSRPSDAAADPGAPAGGRPSADHRARRRPLLTGARRVAIVAGDGRRRIRAPGPELVAAGGSAGRAGRRRRSAGARLVPDAAPAVHRRGRQRLRRPAGEPASCTMAPSSCCSSAATPAIR